MDVDASAAMAIVFPGVCSERRQKSPRLPEGKAAESFCAESIEWKSRSCDSSCVLFGGGSADIDEHNRPSKVEMTHLWRLFDRR